MATFEHAPVPRKPDPVIVEGLAQDLGLPTDLVAEVYERELARLEPKARIKSFLPVIAAHCVRIAVLEQRDADK